MFNFRKKPEYTTIGGERQPAAASAAEAEAGTDTAESDDDAGSEPAAQAAPAAPRPLATPAPAAALPRDFDPPKVIVNAPVGKKGAKPARDPREGRKLNLVDRNILLKAIDEAVRLGVRRHIKKLEPETLDLVVFGARTELVRLLKRSSRSVRGMPKAAFLKEVEEDRARILAERDRVFAELESMQGELEQRKVGVQNIERQLVRESRQKGMEKDEALIQRMFELFGGNEASHEMVAIREQVTFMLLQNMQTERDKVVEAQMAEHRKEVENFERRISKLNESLELTEVELQRMAKAKGIEPGVASIYRTVQGLSGEESDLEVKQEMMSSIFEANLELQKGTAA